MASHIISLDIDGWTTHIQMEPGYRVLGDLLHDLPGDAELQRYIDAAMAGDDTENDMNLNSTSVVVRGVVSVVEHHYTDEVLELSTADLRDALLQYSSWSRSPEVAGPRRELYVESFATELIRDWRSNVAPRDEPALAEALAEKDWHAALSLVLTATAANAVPLTARQRGVARDVQRWLGLHIRLDRGDESTPAG